VPDIVVLGAGAAGTAAAILLHRRGLSGVLVEQAGRPAKKAHAPDWLSAAGLELYGQLGVDCRGCAGEPFAGMTFHSADLKKTAASAATEPPGWRVDYPRLTARLQEAARDAGVDIRYDSRVNRIDLGEGRIVLGLENDEPIEGRFLLLADGAARTMLAGGPGAPPAVLGEVPAKVTGRWFATLEAAAAPGGRQARDNTMHWLLGLDRRQSCMLWWWEDASIVFSLLSAGTGEEARALLCEITSRLAGAGLVALRGAVDPAAVTLRPAPARSALEIESHVEKRCLLVGDTGGFLSETSGEGIYPATWSARLAVDSIVEAINSPHPQDQLRQFSTVWRSTMAEYLRPPNTDIHFLLPLIFSNRQMADRMAAAFWKGQNI
jgi:2-polyprenyl-6-methoxyphenol hydroxylase-like FAD-dependent oxidoreductase